MESVKKSENKKEFLCPRCGTELVIKYTELIKDYCPRCKDGLVYVIDTETGKGKQIFFKDLMGL